MMGRVGYFQDTVLHLLRGLDQKVSQLLSQQSEIDADVAALQADDTAILAEIAKLQAANPSLDLTALKAAVDATAAIVPPAPPVA